MKKKKTITFIILSILGVLIVGFGVTYAWLTLTLNGTKNNVLKVGNLSLVLDDTNGEGILVEGALPMLDETGLAQDPYTFSLTNNGTLESGYAIYLDDLELEDGEERVDDSKIKYSFIRDGETVNTALVSTLGEHPNRILETGKINPDTTYNYELRLWVDSEAGNEVMGKVFRGKIRVEAMQIIEKASTQKDCFSFNSSIGQITDYLCYEGNTNGLPTITDVVIPSKIDGVEVIKIGSNSFRSKQLTNVDIPNTVTTIGTAAFSYNQLTKVIIPKGVVNIGNTAFRANQLVSVEISESVTSIEANAFYGNQLTNIIIPDSVTSIGDSAFGMNQLVSVKISESVTNIEASTFYANQLTNIVIPDSVTSIANNAFANNQLTNITIPSSVTNIGNAAFQRNQLTSVLFQEGITSIEYSAFEENELTSIIIPSSVISIGSNAFRSNQLTSVIIKGKANKNAFTNYPSASPFGWASGYSDSNITWNG